MGVVTNLSVSASNIWTSALSVRAGCFLQVFVKPGYAASIDSVLASHISTASMTIALQFKPEGGDYYLDVDSWAVALTDKQRGQNKVIGPVREGGEWRIGCPIGGFQSGQCVVRLGGH